MNILRLLARLGLRNPCDWPGCPKERKYEYRFCQRHRLLWGSDEIGANEQWWDDLAKHGLQPQDYIGPWQNLP